MSEYDGLLYGAYALCIKRLNIYNNEKTLRRHSVTARSRNLEDARRSIVPNIYILSATLD